MGSMYMYTVGLPFVVPASLYRGILLCSSWTCTTYTYIRLSLQPALYLIQKNPLFSSLQLFIFQTKTFKIVCLLTLVASHAILFIAHVTSLSFCEKHFKLHFSAV